MVHSSFLSRFVRICLQSEQKVLKGPTKYLLAKIRYGYHKTQNLMESVEKMQESLPKN